MYRCRIYISDDPARDCMMIFDLSDDPYEGYVRDCKVRDLPNWPLRGVLQNADLSKLKESYMRFEVENRLLPKLVGKWTSPTFPDDDAFFDDSETMLYYGK